METNSHPDNLARLLIAQTAVLMLLSHVAHRSDGPDWTWFAMAALLAGWTIYTAVLYVRSRANGRRTS